MYCSIYYWECDQVTHCRLVALVYCTLEQLYCLFIPGCILSPIDHCGISLVCLRWLWTHPLVSWLHQYCICWLDSHHYLDIFIMLLTLICQGLVILTAVHCSHSFLIYSVINAFTQLIYSLNTRTTSYFPCKYFPIQSQSTFCSIYQI